ncbi:adaptin N terminal region-domain-containing protein [Phakopsora pachyrhizi]|nr:adaptin N terminal region-domain-containing protein [Phakopsora pachyrhizi]
MDLSLITTHAQRLSARLSENISERSKELGLDPVYNSSNPSSIIASKLPILSHAQNLLGNPPGLWDKVSELSSTEAEVETRRLLGSKSPSDRLQGLKRVTVMMCRNRPVLSFFPYVTNCLHSPSSSSVGNSGQLGKSDDITIRHLVSIYILQHSRLSPDLALLSVNAWQKDLLDPSPVIRSVALRTLAGMGLESVFPLVTVTIDRLVNDPSWLVKRTVAESLVQIHQVDSETYRERIIEGPLSQLLKVRSPLVIGSALIAFEVICPNRWNLIHRQFRTYTSMLLDADDTSQHVLMRVLVRYVREHFKEPDPRDSKLDQDLERLLTSASALFMSRNTAVVICATNVYLYLTPQTRWPAVVKPLIRLISEKSAENQEGLLLKIVKELRFYTDDPDLVIAKEVIRIVGEFVLRAGAKERREGLELLFDLTRNPQSLL